MVIKILGSFCGMGLLAIIALIYYLGPVYIIWTEVNWFAGVLFGGIVLPLLSVLLVAIIKSLVAQIDLDKHKGRGD